MMPSVLLIAFHFPPLTGSSGIQRALRFAQYLPAYGWKPVVLTVTSNVYESSDPATIDQIPPDCKIVRVPCFNTARHLAIAGRYPGWLAIPDRWRSWAWLGTYMGIRACLKNNVSAIWSTYPIATAHILGAKIAAATGLPWLADFRDPMAQPGYPADPRQWQAFRNIETTAANGASRLIFVSPSALESYRKLFDRADSEKFVLLENGYDESIFSGVQASREFSDSATGPVVLLHSGIVYPLERDPEALFQALARLLKEGRIREGELLIRFRSPGHADLIENLARHYQIAPIIQIEPAVPYQQAIDEMTSVDGLLLMQGATCNEQIPAKAYEYLRAGRPILGLTDPAGDTGRMLIDQGIPHVVALEDSAGIGNSLLAFLRAVRQNDAVVAPRARVERFSRKRLTGRLAQMLDEVTSSAKIMT